MRPQNSSTGKYPSVVHSEGWAAEVNRRGTIIFTKDLSPDMIDILGTKYSVEPEFFADHLRGSEAFRKGKWLPVVRSSPEDPPILHETSPFLHS